MLLDERHTAQEKSASKAEAATAKRFEAANEFRAQLSDQAATFMPRGEAEVVMSRNTEAIQDLTNTVSGMVRREEIMAAWARNNERYQELSERVTRSEGHGSGLSAGWLYLLGAIAAISTVINIYLAVKGH